MTTKMKEPGQDVLEAGPDKYVLCRTYGHAWNEHSSDHWFDADSPGFPDTVVCLRCGMERRDTLKANGALMRRNYLYPPSYLLVKGVKRPRRDAYRLRLLSMRLKGIRRG